MLTNTVISESYASIGAVFVLENTITFVENVTVVSNFGSVYVMNGALYLQGNTTFENNILNSPVGGTLTVYRGTVNIGGVTWFTGNTAGSGAAIYAANSNVLVSGSATIVNNTARYNGGGIYLYQTPMQCNDICVITLIGNRALQNGGGVYAVSSAIDILSSIDLNHALLSLIENSARVGGGLYMEANAKLYISKTGRKTNDMTISCSSIVFSYNLAEYGGAVFVEDGTNLGVCDSIPHQTPLLTHSPSLYINTDSESAAECFFDVLNLNQQFYLDYDNNSINFTHNYAHYTGSTIFGGLLDRCIPGSLDVDTSTTKRQYYDGMSYLIHISNLLEDKVSSHPVKLCFCKSAQPDCSYKLPKRHLKKGENFTVALVAADQVNHTISNATIRAYLKFVESGFGEGQLIQKTGNFCTNLTYSVTSPHDFEQVVVYAEGPCRDSGISRKQIDIKFIPCSCPIGFQKKDTENSNCVCICDSVLLQYISTCNAHEGT